MVCLALVAITFVAFWGVLSSSFINYDDDKYVTGNPQVQAGLRAGSIVWALTTTSNCNWHPLTWLSHMLDVQLFGLDAGKHHLTSLLLHAASAVLLFLLLRRMTGALWRSAFVACLFAIHPLHVESAAWIAERKDVLSTLFWLLTLAAWLWYVDSKTPARYFLALAFYALGLMAKPMLVTLPFTLLLLDYWPLRRLELPLRGNGATLAALVREKWPLFAMSAASCTITFAAQWSGGAVGDFEKVTLAERAANAALSYASYLGKTFWPASLAVFYPHPRVGLFTAPVAGAALLLGALTAVALWFGKRAPYLAFGWLWYVGTLVPVIGLIQVGGQAMADRYTYVPLIGIFVAVAWGLADLVRASRALRWSAAVGAGAVIAALVPVTRLEVSHWRGDAPLYEHALSVTKDNWLVLNNLASARIGQGKGDEAIPLLMEALRIRPDFFDAHYNLGMALVRQRRAAEAIEHLTRALELRPDDVKAHNNLGLALAMEGRVPEAIGQYEQAIRLDPGHAESWNYLGLMLARTNRMADAVERFEQALRINPGFAEAHANLGAALAQLDRLPEAVEHFQRALQIKPDLESARVNLQKAQEALRRPR